MSKIGSLVYLQVATKLLVGETSTDIAQAANIIDVSAKADGRGRGLEYGRLSTTINVSGIADTTPSATKTGIKELLDLQLAGTKVAVSIANYTSVAGTTDVTGDILFTGTALISNVQATFADDTGNTFSATLEIDGLLTTALATA